jgi:hypothetical protein
VGLEVLEDNFDFWELGHDDYILRNGVIKEAT